MRNQIEATEYEAGYTGDTYCAVCELLLEKGTVIPVIPSDTNEEEKPQEPSTPEEDSPSVDAPSMDKPSTDKPSTDTPDVDESDTDTPNTDTPNTDTPSTDTPSIGAPDTGDGTNFVLWISIMFMASIFGAITFRKRVE